MPLVPQGVVALSVTVQDYTGEKSDATVYFPANVAINLVIDELAAIQAIFAALTDGFIVGGTISQKLTQTDPFGVGPPATSDVNRKGIFTFRNSGGTANKYEIPSIDRTLVGRGSNNLDQAADAIANYIDLMINGGVGALVSAPVTGAGLDIVALLSARETSRNTDPNR